MPLARLDEKDVQRIAVNWLATYYRRQSDVQAVVSEMEVVVHPQTRFAYGRADGLIVTQRTDGTILTAALEAKSARTIRNIREGNDDDEWLKHGVTAGGCGALLVLWIGWFVGMGVWMWLVPVAAFLLIGFGYLWATQKHRRYRKIDVILQVKRYPADERWIALSADAYNVLAQPLQEALHVRCRRAGIGVLQVRPTEEVEPQEFPRPPRLPRGCRDPLSYYARAKQIRQKLSVQVDGDHSQHSHRPAR